MTAYLELFCGIVDQSNVEIKKEFDVTDFWKENLQATDYVHTMAKSHFLCGPNSIKSQSQINIWDLGVEIMVA